MAAMSALCLVLGIMGAMGGTWLVPVGDDAEAMEEMDADTGAGLTSYWIEMDAGSAEMCDMMAGMLGGECDGADYSIAYSEVCDATDEDEVCDMATGGMIGTVGMWAGVVCALIMTLTLALPMAGVDAMDAVPEMVTKIAMWGAGGLMLVGMLGWYLMLGDGDSEMGTHLWMAGAAMSMGLGSALISQFIEADE